VRLSTAPSGNDMRALVDVDDDDDEDVVGAGSHSSMLALLL